MSLTKKDMNMLKNLLRDTKTKPAPKQAKAKRNRRKRNAAAKEVFAITRKVFLFDTGDSVNSGIYEWKAQNIAVLDAYLKLFQSYRIVGNVKISYVPGCSNNDNGTLMVGYSSISGVQGREKIANLSPLMDTSVWQKQNLIIPNLLAREGNASFHGKGDSLFFLNWALNSGKTQVGYPKGEVWATFKQLPLNNFYGSFVNMHAETDVQYSIALEPMMSSLPDSKYTPKKIASPPVDITTRISKSNVISVHPNAFSDMAFSVSDNKDPDQTNGDSLWNFSKIKLSTDAEGYQLFEMTWDYKVNRDIETGIYKAYFDAKNYGAFLGITVKTDLSFYNKTQEGTIDKPVPFGDGTHFDLVNVVIEWGSYLSSIATFGNFQESTRRTISYMTTAYGIITKVKSLKVPIFTVNLKARYDGQDLLPDFLANVLRIDIDTVIKFDTSRTRFLSIEQNTFTKLIKYHPESGDILTSDEEDDYR